MQINFSRPGEVKISIYEGEDHHSFWEKTLTVRE
jgi:hypothetical protein